MAPCDWPIDYSQCGPCSAYADMSTEAIASVEAMAVEYLWNWTLKAFGQCPVAVRPCSAENINGTSGQRMSTYEGWGPYGSGSSTGWGPWPRPLLIDGSWTNTRCGRCTGECACGLNDFNVLRLDGPVASITQILIDGEVLPSSSYRVDRRRLLVRTDGQGWPRSQNLLADPDEEDTFQVTYVQGRPVPAGGRIAAGLLACEMAKALCRDSSCKLPQRVQTITRQGVTMAMIDAGEGLQKGQTGIWLIDSWVGSILNPVRPATVRSPDYRAQLRQPYRTPVADAPTRPGSLLPATLPFIIGS